MLRPKRQSAQTVTVTAPVGGWNAVTSLANMNPNEAVIMDNWFCLPTELQLRGGYTEYFTGVHGNIQSFINYNAMNGNTEFFAAADNNGDCAIYPVVANTGAEYFLTTESGDHLLTEAGDALTYNPVAIIYGLTSAKFHYAQFSNTAGDWTIAVNGSDAPLRYDGTEWIQIGNTGTGAITGIATTSLADVIMHKRRLWFVEKNSLSCWYLATDAVAGAATEFDFGPIFAMGGQIAKLATWTLDAGWGMDDYLVIITTKGEVAVYKGVNPADPADWSLQGVYYIGAPVGDLCTCKYGGDVLLLNKDGLIPLSQCLMSSRVSTRISITNKIQSKISQDTTQYANYYGWQVILNPPLNMLMLNVPTATAGQSYQYVMNTITGAWSRFTNLNATTWDFVNESLYFGLGGSVYKFWDGHNDNGTPIVSDLLPAFSSFGSSVQTKRLTMNRLSMGADNDFSYNTRISLDFDQVSQPNYPNSADVDTSIWNLATWDVSVWGGDIVPFVKWQNAIGMGHYATTRIKTSSSYSDVRFYSVDYIFEAGGVI